MVKYVDKPWGGLIAAGFVIGILFSVINDGYPWKNMGIASNIGILGGYVLIKIIEEIKSIITPRQPHD